MSPGPALHQSAVDPILLSTSIEPLSDRISHFENRHRQNGRGSERSLFKVLYRIIKSRISFVYHIKRDYLIQ